MENDKHTPGPWTVYPRNLKPGDVPSIHVQRGQMIAALGYSDTEPTPNAEADARLISAAPDLLDALRDVLAKTRGTSTMDEIEQSKRRARAAIAKATGEA